MRFRFILPASRPLLIGPSPDRSVDDAPQPLDAAALLSADYRRWSRLLVGTVATLCSTVALFLGLGLVTSGTRLTSTDAAIAVALLAASLVGLVVLLQLHRSGRALLTATHRWTALHHRSGQGRPSAAGWLAARTVNVEPPVFARIATSSLAGIAGILGVSTIAMPRDPGALDLAPAAATSGILLLVVCAGQMGGVMRLVNAIAEGDALWTRIRGAFGRP